MPRRFRMVEGSGLAVVNVKVITDAKARDPIQRVINFLKYIKQVHRPKSPFRDACAANWLTESVADKVETAAKNTINEEVYSKGSGSSSGNAMESIKVGAINDYTGMAVYSDPAVSPSIAGENEGEYSYLAFFEDPDNQMFGKGSFIRQRGEKSINRYRPFMTPMTHAVADVSVKAYVRSVRSVIKLKIPRTLK